jgi:mannose-6-phosphate isomerase-like protein (cupin superfamily)
MNNPKYQPWRVSGNPSDYTVTFITTAEESDCETTEIEVELLPEGRNHLYRNLICEEKFIPISGMLEIVFGDNHKVQINPGEQFTVPIGIGHYFINPGTEPIRFRSLIQPGHEGFENCLRIMNGMAADGKLQVTDWTDVQRIAVFLQLGEIRPCGKESAINPFIADLYTSACENGIAQELLGQYALVDRHRDTKKRKQSQIKGEKLDA